MGPARHRGRATRMFERWRQESLRSTGGKRSCLMHSSITGSSRRTRPAPSPIPSAVLWIRRSVRRAPISPSSNANTAPPPRTTPSSTRPTMRGFKIALGTLGKRLRTARARVARLFEQRRDVAKRVEVRDLSERAVVKLATERKHLTDIIKMVAYQAESDLVTLLRPHYARADQEGEPCSMSCSPRQATSASPIASCISPWLRSARRIEPTPPRHSVRCSTKPRQSSPARACGFASQCVRHPVSGLPSPARRSSAAPPRLFRRLPDRRQNRTFCATLCQEV